MKKIKHLLIVMLALVGLSSNGQFVQQGPKLFGTGAIGTADQGDRVSISGDGNTAIVGGYADNGGIGAAWIYTRSGGVWSQHGSKLVGTGFVNVQFNPNQGSSVAISADGNTAIIGGPNDDSTVGAAWIFICLLYTSPSPRD